MSKKNLLQDFEKGANYSVLAILAVNTLSAMSRFKNVPREQIMTSVYGKLKARAAANK